MSFSGDVKTELCRISITKRCCALAELYGIALFASTFNPCEIRIMTGNQKLFKRIELLSGAAMKEKPLWQTLSVNAGRHTIFLSDRDEIKKVYKAFEYDIDAQIALHLNGWLVEEDCCRAAFLRGMFLTGGYAADPEKLYCLDISGTHRALMREVYVLLSEMELKPKLTRRKENHVIYFKECERIENFLTLAGAHRSVIALMEARVIKDVRNGINRKVNCETANLFKTVDTGNSQVEVISAFFAAGGDRGLDDRLREAGELRLKYPDEPLSRLAELARPPVSKSGFNHRIRKLLQLASERAGPGGER